MKRLSFFVLIPAFFSGCAFYNPFVPHNGSVIVDEGCSLPPQEPITNSAMYRSTMKSYTVNGKRYEPFVPHIGQRFRGIASWYGPNFHGGKTANGEYYDMTTMTAAHKTLPMNTRVRVTNLDNGMSTIVRINDRGPFVENRIIDLSQAAADAIGMIRKGTARVELEVVDYDTQVDKYRYNKPFPQATHSLETAVSTAVPTQEAISPLEKSEPTAVATDMQSIKPSISKPPAITTPKTTPPTHTSNATFKVQILSTTNHQKARQIAKKYATIADHHTEVLGKSVMGQPLYRVYVKNFKSIGKAQAFIKQHKLKGAFVTKD